MNNKPGEADGKVGEDNNSHDPHNATKRYYLIERTLVAKS